MTKLRREKVKKIEQMIRDGYLDVEIHESTSVSRKAIRRIRLRVEKEMEMEKSMKKIIFGVETETITVGTGNQVETVEFLDLKGRKIRFEDIMNLEKFKDGTWANESTLVYEFNFYWDEIEELRSGLENTLLHSLKYGFECSKCKAKGDVAVKVFCTKCGEETGWGFLSKKSE